MTMASTQVINQRDVMAAPQWPPVCVTKGAVVEVCPGPHPNTYSLTASITGFAQLSTYLKVTIAIQIPAEYDDTDTDTDTDTDADADMDTDTHTDTDTG